MILTLCGKTCALMCSVHASAWHVLIAVAKRVKGRAWRVQVKKGSGLKTPLRTVIPQMTQAPLIHHVTQTVAMGER